MKDEILETALKQFLKYGIREMSIQKLIEPLGISTKTVYKYFKDKEDLLEQALDLFHAQHRETWKNLSANKNSVSLFFDIWRTAVDLEYKVNKSFFQDLHYYYPQLESKKEAALSKEYSKQFIQVIYKGMEEGFFQKDIKPEIIFTGISVLYRAMVREGQFSSFRASAYEILFNTIALYIRGFCTRNGMEALEEHIRTLKTKGEVKVKKEKTAAVRS